MPDDRSPQSRRVPDETASPLRYTITPGIHSPIAMKTLPHAVCHVHPEDDADPQHSFKLFADPEGIVRFHVRPAGESKEVAKLVVDCVVNGKLVRHPLHLRPSFEATSDMPSPPAERPLAQRADARIRPALSYDEAMRLTERDALTRGYPMRPNPDEAPKAFSAWLRAVSAPAYGIEPYFVSNPDVTHGKGKQHAPQSFTNWSGFELLRSFRLAPRPAGIALTEPYDWVTGTWHVPAVTGERFIQTYSALWVGLDGDNTPDLVQAGTEQDSMNIWLPYVGELTLSRYYIWTEFLPQQPTEQIITNFTVSPGDEILTEVWVGRSDDEPSLSGAFGRFFIMNLSTGGFADFSTPRGSTTVVGREAVWIMERPTLAGNVLPDLAKYDSAVMYSASARKANSPRYQGYVDYLGARNLQDTMTNTAGTNTLSTVTAIDSNSMRFEWKGFN
jgi:hypothetical protein